MSESDLVLKLRRLPPSHCLQEQAATAIERLREEVVELERRLDLPSLIREASEVCGKKLQLRLHCDGSGSLRVYSDQGNSTARVTFWSKFKQAEPIIDFIEQNKKPSLSEQLHDGARVKLRNGDECKIRKRECGSWTYRCGEMSWREDGTWDCDPFEHTFDIVEVLSSD